MNIPVSCTPTLSLLKSVEIFHLILIKEEKRKKEKVAGKDHFEGKFSLINHKTLGEVLNIKWNINDHLECLLLLFFKVLEIFIMSS